MNLIKHILEFASIANVVNSKVCELTRGISFHLNLFLLTAEKRRVAATHRLFIAIRRFLRPQGRGAGR